MSNLSWDNTQDSKLFDNPLTEETIIDNLNLRFTPSNANFVVLSTTLPYTPEELTDKAEKVSNGVELKNIKVPKVLEDKTFYISCRISLDTETSDKYFYIEAKNVNTSWDINKTEFEESVYGEIDYQLKLKNADGNETFKKISGTLPSNVFLSESGKIYGRIMESDSDTEFSFTVGVFRNGKLIDTEELQPLEIYINVTEKSKNSKPYWITESGYLGSILTGNNVYFSIYAYSLSKHKINYEIVDDELSSNIYKISPGLLFDSNTGVISGTALSNQTKSWHFTVVAHDVINGTSSDERTFWINSNPISEGSKLYWYKNGIKLENPEYIDLGSYKIGETFSGEIIAKSENSELPVTYTITVGETPEGFVLYPTGEYAGNYGGELDFQKAKTYKFKIQATNGQDTIETEFRITAEANLGYNAVNACLRLNLDNLAEYDDIKAQLKVDENYKGFNKKYRTGSLPKIDICKLSCFDKIILSAMFEDYGNAEKIMFRKTEQKSFCDGTDDYDVFYKTLDEDTFQWTDVPYGTYDYDSALKILKEKDDEYKNTKLDWNVPDKYIDTLNPTEEMILTSYAGIRYYTENMEMKTITLNVTPADSDIILVCDGYEMVREGNSASITVPRGAVVRYRVSHESYISAPEDDLPMGVIEAKTNITKNIILMRESSYSLTVSCNEPENGYHVEFDIAKLEEDYPDIPYILDDDYVSGERTIYVPDVYTKDGVETNVSIEYAVSSTGYITQIKQTVVEEELQHEIVNLEKINYTLSFNIRDYVNDVDITSSSDIVLIVNGEEIHSDIITVPYKTVVFVSVSSPGYKTVTTSYTALADSNNTIRLLPSRNVVIEVGNLSLLENIYIFATLNGTKVAEGYNRIEFDVAYGDDIHYEASSDHYIKHIANIRNITTDINETIIMNLQSYDMTIVPNPADSTVKIWIEEYGEESATTGIGSQTLSVKYSQTLKWVVSKTYFESENGSKQCLGEYVENVDLARTTYTVTIHPSAEQPKTGTIDTPSVLLMCNGETIYGNSITVPSESDVYWEVYNNHCVTRNGTISHITSNVSQTVKLDLKTIQFSVAEAQEYRNISSPAMIRIISGSDETIAPIIASMVVKWGDIVDYYISKNHFNQYKDGKRVSGSMNIQPEDDNNITIYPVMDIDYYTTTINYDSSTSSLIITSGDGTQPVNNKITTKYGVAVSYTVTSSSYSTPVVSDTIIPERNNTIDIDFDDNYPYSFEQNVSTEREFTVMGDGIYALMIVGGGGGSCAGGQGGKGNTNDNRIIQPQGGS